MGRSTRVINIASRRIDELLMKQFAGNLNKFNIDSI